MRFLKNFKWVQLEYSNQCTKYFKIDNFGTNDLGEDKKKFKAQTCYKWIDIIMLYKKFSSIT
jgi:hypothetical protein